VVIAIHWISAHWRKRLKNANGCRRRIIADLSTRSEEKFAIIGDIKQEVRRAINTPDMTCDVYALSSTLTVFTYDA